MRTLRTTALVMLVTSATAMLAAQQTKASVAPPPAKPAPPATTVPAAPADATKPAPPAAEAYAYDAAGRRDPFLSLIGIGSDGKAGSKRGEGPAGMSIAEISVRGVLESRGKLVAMVMGPDNKTYIVHQGDKLLDGTIKSIMPTGLVIEQEVNDPLSVIKQREIRKLLRGLEDAK